MGWIIRAWIPVEVDDPITYATFDEAWDEIGQLKSMQPENKYEIDWLDDEEEEHG